jgi:hypothetical protein
LLKYFVRLSEIGVSYADLPTMPPFSSHVIPALLCQAVVDRTRSHFLVALYQKEDWSAIPHPLSGKEATTLRFRNYVVERKAQRLLARQFGFAF